MTDETRRAALAEDRLPPPETLDAWAVPDPAHDLTDRMFAAGLRPPQEEAPTMHPTPLSNRRPVATPVVLGVVLAAAVLAAFWLGRRSVASPPPPATPMAVPVAAPDCSGPVATPTCPPAQVVTVPVPLPIEPECATEQALGGGAPPAGKRPKRTHPTPAPSRKAIGLKDPFGKTSTLRLGTERGVGPAEVAVDGRWVGTTPLPSVKVAPGRHYVRFRFAGGLEIARRVTVKDGETEVVRASGPKRTGP